MSIVDLTKAGAHAGADPALNPTTPPTAVVAVPDPDAAPVLVDQIPDPRKTAFDRSR